MNAFPVVRLVRVTSTPPHSQRPNFRRPPGDALPDDFVWPAEPTGFAVAVAVGAAPLAWVAA